MKERKREAEGESIVQSFRGKVKGMFGGGFGSVYTVNKCSDKVFVSLRIFQICHDSLPSMEGTREI